MGSVLFYSQNGTRVGWATVIFCIHYSYRRLGQTVLYFSGFNSPGKRCDDPLNPPAVGMSPFLCRSWYLTAPSFRHGQARATLQWKEQENCDICNTGYLWYYFLKIWRLSIKSNFILSQQEQNTLKGWFSPPRVEGSWLAEMKETPWLCENCWKFMQLLKQCDLTANTATRNWLFLF